MFLPPPVQGVLSMSRVSREEGRVKVRRGLAWPFASVSLSVRSAAAAVPPSLLEPEGALRRVAGWEGACARAKKSACGRRDRKEVLLASMKGRVRVQLLPSLPGR